MRAGSYYYPPRTDDVTDGRICFKADGLDMQVYTRTSEVTTANLSSFIFNAEIDEFYADDDDFSLGTNSGGGCGVATKSGSVYVTDKYWPDILDPSKGESINCIYVFATNLLPENVTYQQDLSSFDYYNLPTYEIICQNSGFDCFVPNVNTDYIVSIVNGASTVLNNERRVVSLTFRHLLSRIGTVAVNAPSGYTCTVNSISFTYPTQGYYRVLNNSMSVSCNDEELNQMTSSLSVGSNDVWFVPSNNLVYDEDAEDLNLMYIYVDPSITINYTLTKGDFTKTYEKSQTITPNASQCGKTLNLTINITTDEAQAIQLNSTVTAWSAQATSLTIN